MNGVMRTALCVCLCMLAGIGYTCEHNGRTNKCMICLRQNYLSYGKERAAITCGEAGCASKTLEHHKHCGIHGSIVTMSKECPECARAEAKEHWKQAELARQEDKAFSNLGIRVPEYREHVSYATKQARLRELRNRINLINKRIEDYENRLFQPGMSGSVINRLETKISELEFQRDIYFRAYEMWEAVTPQ